MFIKEFEVNNKKLIYKRFIIKIFFYAFTKAEVKIFRKL